MVCGAAARSAIGRVRVGGWSGAAGRRKAHGVGRERLLPHSTLADRTKVASACPSFARRPQPTPSRGTPCCRYAGRHHATWRRACGYIHLRHGQPAPRSGKQCAARPRAEASCSRRWARTRHACLRADAALCEEPATTVDIVVVILPGEKRPARHPRGMARLEVLHPVCPQSSDHSSRLRSCLAS